MATAFNDDVFTPDVSQEPYMYFGRMRTEEPVHYNEPYDAWLVTRYDDMVWLTRHLELFSNETLKRDPYPSIKESALGIYPLVRDFFLLHHRPAHADMGKVIEIWHPMVREAIKQLLDETEAKNEIDVMLDFATSLPLLVIAQMLGTPP